MFKYLTEYYWNNFMKTQIIDGEEKIIHDGQKFEKLTKALLNQMYGKKIKWHSTNKTHDGNRDFYAVDDLGNKLWAECKNYSKKIELKTIAPTIVMAQISYVDEILFFSYSEINRQAKQKLSIYASQNSKKIFFYDDYELEKIIFKYREKILPVFFPNFKQNEPIVFDLDPYSFVKSGVGICVSAEETTAPDVFCARLNDIIYVGVGILSRIPNKEIKIQIGIKAENDLLYLKQLDPTFSKDDIIYSGENDIIQPMSANFHVFYFVVSNYKEKIKLPDFFIRYNIDDSPKETILCTPLIKVDSLFLSELMGCTYQNIVNYFSNKFFSNDYVKVLYLKGESGVGKTRMLSEFTSVLVRNRYQIINFQSLPDDKTGLHIVKEIIYKLYNLSEEVIIESLKEPALEGVLQHPGLAPLGQVVHQRVVE